MSGYTLQSHELPSAKYKRNATVLGICLLIYVAASTAVGFNPLMLITEFQYIANLANDMVPPNLEIVWSTPKLFATMGQTLGMAFLGTLIGGLIAMVLAFFAASNVMPVTAVRLAVRTLMVMQRVTPTFIVLLVLQIFLGVGAYSGMIALCIGSFGMFGKLFADAVEHVDGGPLEAIESTGATRSQVVRYGILPQVMPSFIANMFYAFDINMRQAINLGIFGGGGLGFEIYKANKTLQYKNQLALILIVIVLIAAMERVSDWLRRKVISKEVLR